MDQTPPPTEPIPPRASQPIGDQYQPPGDHELSPEMQLAWFELNREQTQRLYFSVMRKGGLVGAIVAPLILVVTHYLQARGMEMTLGLPELHEDVNTAAIYWVLIGVPAGFLIGVALAALGFNLLQRFR